MSISRAKGKPTGSGMVLTSRDQRIIRAVAEHGALTRAQVAKALGFGSVARTNAVLLRLVKHKYISVRTQPTLAGSRRYVYTIGSHGVELLTGDSRSIRRFHECSDFFLAHCLGVNDAWLAFATDSTTKFEFVRWLSEVELGRLSLGCIPDGFVEYNIDGYSFGAFLEIDRGTEGLNRWEAKLRAYMNLAFGNQFQNVFNRRFFRVLVVVPSAQRLEQVRRTIRQKTEQLFWLTTHDELVEQGPFARIWRRPVVGDLQSLIPS